jgi:hypothetical protein
LYRFLIAESIQAHLPKDIFNEQVTHISEHTIDKILKLQ